MHKYFILLNWTLLLAVLFCGLRLVPFLHGFAALGGALTGAMMCGGFLSWEFRKDQSEDKEYRWRSMLFEKDYVVEMGARLGLLVMFFLLGSCLWSKLHFLTGMFIVYTVALVVEWSWAVFHHFGHYSKNKMKGMKK